MISYAPNISWLLPELPFGERPAAIARLGFKAVEFGFPSHADLDALDVACQEYDLQIALFNQDVPVWDRANRGYLVDPRRRDEFRRKLDEALQIASRLPVMKIMLPAGVVLPDMTRQEQRNCMVENLLYAAPLAADIGVLLTIEALNPEDNPGYYLTTSQEGIEVVKLVDDPNIRFQFDTYHISMVEGDLVTRLENNSQWIGHIQFADYPGRHEPGTGAIDFDELWKAIENTGYQGYIGLEYIPQAAGIESFEWVPPTKRAFV